MTASVQFLTGVHTVMECAVGIWPSTLVMVSFHLRKYVECILIASLILVIVTIKFFYYIFVFSLILNLSRRHRRNCEPLVDAFFTGTEVIQNMYERLTVGSSK